MSYCYFFSKMHLLSSSDARLFRRLFCLMNHKKILRSFIPEELARVSCSNKHVLSIHSPCNTSICPFRFDVTSLRSDNKQRIPKQRIPSNTKTSQLTFRRKNNCCWKFLSDNSFRTPILRALWKQRLEKRVCEGASSCRGSFDQKNRPACNKASSSTPRCLRCRRGRARRPHDRHTLAFLLCLVLRSRTAVGDIRPTPWL